MRRLLPRDPLIYARIFAALAIGLWLAVGGDIYLPAAFATLGIVLATAVLLAVAERRRGGPYRVIDYPIAALVADVGAAGLWMVGTALVPRSIAFVLIVVIGSMATFRLGTPGAALTAGVYLVARIATELIRLANGVPTPSSQLIGDTIVTGVAIIILSSVVESYRAERRRGLRTLARSKVFEKAAIDISAQTDPEGILATIPGRALDLIDARFAALIVHREAEFVMVAGAGIGTSAVGVHSPTTTGVAGVVVRERRTIQVPDYQLLAGVPEPVRDLGLRSAVAVPIIAHGEVAAILLLARLEVRQFDVDEVAALEGSPRTPPPRSRARGSSHRPGGSRSSVEAWPRRRRSRSWSASQTRPRPCSMLSSSSARSSTTACGSSERWAVRRRCAVARAAILGRRCVISSAGASSSSSPITAPNTGGRRRPARLVSRPRWPRGSTR